MAIAEDYRIIDKLGNQVQRKFGDTFIVEQKNTGVQSVMKALKKGRGSEVIEERLRKEAQFVFNFPGLPEKGEFYESETEILLLRPFYPGEEIGAYWKRLKRKQRFPFLLDFVNKLSPIFDHLDSLSIVHCDIKPSNILIEEKADDFNVHLIDFGLAIKKTDKEQRATLFPLGFAAPELLLNHLDVVNQRTDIYALGILVWRLYAEQLPLAHPNPSIFTNLQLTHPLPEHSAISKPLYKVLQKMCYKHPFKIPPNKMKSDDVKTALKQAMNERYSNLEEILDALQEVGNKKSFYQRISFR